MAKEMMDRDGGIDEDDTTRELRLAEAEGTRFSNR